MSDLLNDDDLRTEREPVKEPSERWRNWWIATCKTNGRCAACGFFQAPHLPGQVYGAHCVWPSKDMAETQAEWAIRNRETQSRYIGAFPDGEAP